MNFRTVALVALAVSSLHAELRQDIEYIRRGDRAMLLDAYIPESGRSHPAIIWIHGGGFTTGDKAPYPRDLLDRAARERFAWFSVNYRLAPADPFPAQTDDVEAAVHFIKGHADVYHVDPNRLVLMGESAGGHLVSFVGAKHEPANRVAAVVSFFGEHDLITRTHPKGACMADGKEVPNAGPFCLSPGLSKFLGITSDSPTREEIVKRASPANFVTKDTPPYLLIHGTKDFAVPYDQSIRMCEVMKGAGVECRIIAIEGGGHGRGSLDKCAGSMDYRAEMFRWLQTHLPE